MDSLNNRKQKKHIPFSGYISPHNQCFRFPTDSTRLQHYYECRRVFCLFVCCFFWHVCYNWKLIHTCRRDYQGLHFFKYYANNQGLHFFKCYANNTTIIHIWLKVKRYHQLICLHILYYSMFTKISTRFQYSTWKCVHCITGINFGYCSEPVSLLGFYQ